MPFRAAAYTRLNLTPAQEDSVVLWNLFFHRSSEYRWDKYWKAKEAQDFGTRNTVFANKSE